MSSSQDKKKLVDYFDTPNLSRQKSLDVWFPTLGGKDAVVRRGYLEKAPVSASLFGGWNKRYIVLLPDKVHWYDDEDYEDPLGEFLLTPEVSVSVDDGVLTLQSDTKCLSLRVGGHLNNEEQWRNSKTILNAWRNSFEGQLSTIKGSGSGSVGKISAKALRRTRSAPLEATARPVWESLPVNSVWQGYLEKAPVSQASIFGGWTRRFILLTPDKVFWYKTEDDREPLGELCLTAETSLELTNGQLALQTGVKRLTLHSDTDDSSATAAHTSAWQDAFVNQIRALRKETSRASKINRLSSLQSLQVAESEDKEFDKIHNKAACPPKNDDPHDMSDGESEASESEMWEADEEHASDDDEFPPQTDEAAIILQGYLEKAPVSAYSIFGGWSLRFMVLLQEKIRWYKTEGDLYDREEPLGEFAFTEDTTLTLSASSFMHDTLTLQSGTKRLVVRSSDDDDEESEHGSAIAPEVSLEGWKAAIERQLRLKKGSRDRLAKLLHAEQVERIATLRAKLAADKEAKDGVSPTTIEKESEASGSCANDADKNNTVGQKLQRVPTGAACSEEKKSSGEQSVQKQAPRQAATAGESVQPNPNEALSPRRAYDDAPWRTDANVVKQGYLEKAPVSRMSLFGGWSTRFIVLLQDRVLWFRLEEDRIDEDSEPLGDIDLDSEEVTIRMDRRTGLLTLANQGKRLVLRTPLDETSTSWALAHPGAEEVPPSALAVLEEWADAFKERMRTGKSNDNTRRPDKKKDMAKDLSCDETLIEKETWLNTFANSMPVTASDPPKPKSWEPLSPRSRKNVRLSMEVEFMDDGVTATFCGELLAERVAKVLSIGLCAGKEAVPESLQRPLPLSLTPKQFRSLGRLCSLDMLLNNEKRGPLPLSGDHTCLLSEVLVSEDGDSVTVKGARVHALKDGAVMQRYLDRVRMMAIGVTYGSQIPGGTKAQAEVAMKLCQGLRSHYPGSFRCHGAVVQVLFGLREGLMAVADCWDSGDLGRCIDDAENEIKLELPGEEAIRHADHKAGFVRRVAAEIWSAVRGSPLPSMLT